MNSRRTRAWSAPVTIVTFFLLSIAGRDAAAQPWSNDATLTRMGTQALAVDGIALASTPTMVARGSLVMGVPPGSTIESAVLFTSIRMRNDVTQPMAVPGAVTLAGRPVINGGGMTIPTTTALGWRCASGVCYYTARVDVSAIVRDAFTAAPSAASFSIEVGEQGDSLLLSGFPSVGEQFAYLGHTLVIRYSNTRVLARQRFVGVWYGASDETLESLTLTSPLPPMAQCASGARLVAARDERVTVSATIASEENACGESNELLFGIGGGMTLREVGVGGADDAVPPSPVLNCADLGRSSDLRVLLTTGTFGSATGVATSASDRLFGASAGFDGDSLGATPAPRGNDEVMVLPSVPLNVRFSQAGSGSTRKSLSVIAMQYPVDGDSDGDGHSDIVEGICERIDTDRDSNQREDWDDSDSDNDCLPDRIEINTDRTTPSSVAESDRACATAAAMGGTSTRFCDRSSSACVSCSINCAGNTQGPTCLRRGDGTLGCGCVNNAECASGFACAGGVCTATVRDSGVADSGDAAVDSGASDAGDGAASDASDSALADGAERDAVMADGANEDSGASDGASDGAGDGASGDAGSKGPSVSYGGGACTCRAGARSAGDGRAAIGLLGAVIALASARRTRARRATV